MDIIEKIKALPDEAEAEFTWPNDILWYDGSRDFTGADLKALADRVEAAEAKLAVAESVIREALEPGVFGIQDRSGISTPEDTVVDRLGNQIGFGALMDSASRMWAIRAAELGHPGSEFVTGPCRAVRDAWVKKAQQALAEMRSDQAPSGS